MNTTNLNSRIFFLLRLGLMDEKRLVQGSDVLPCKRAKKLFCWSVGILLIEMPKGKLEVFPHSSSRYRMARLVYDGDRR